MLLMCGPRQPRTCARWQQPTFPLWCAPGKPGPHGWSVDSKLWSMTTIWPSCENSTVTTRSSSLDLAPVLPGSVFVPATPYAGRHFADIWASKNTRTLTSFRWVRSPGVTGSSRCDARQGMCRSTDWPCAHSLARWWPAVATWCGRLRAGGRARQATAAAIRLAALCDRRGGVRSDQSGRSLYRFLSFSTSCRCTKSN